MGAEIVILTLAATFAAASGVSFAFFLKSLPESDSLESGKTDETLINRPSGYQGRVGTLPPRRYQKPGPSRSKVMRQKDDGDCGCGK